MVNFGVSPIHGIFSALSILVVLVNVAFYGLAIYFFIRAIRYMKEKNMNDRELIRKMDRLIELQENKNKDIE